MSEEYVFDLDQLRDIGWEHWDPIGQRDQNDRHPHDYDNYLLQAAGLALRGGTVCELRDYLLSCCVDMGAPGNEEAASRTAQAIVAKMARAKARTS